MTVVIGHQSENWFVGVPMVNDYGDRFGTEYCPFPCAFVTREDAADYLLAVLPVDYINMRNDPIAYVMAESELDDVYEARCGQFHDVWGQISEGSWPFEILPTSEWEEYADGTARGCIRVDANHPLWGIRPGEVIRDDHRRSIVDKNRLLKLDEGFQSSNGLWTFITRVRNKSEFSDLVVWFENLRYAKDPCVFEWYCLLFEDMRKRPDQYFHGKCELLVENQAYVTVILHDDKGLYTVEVWWQDIEDASDNTCILEADYVKGEWVPWRGCLAEYPELLRVWPL